MTAVRWNSVLAMVLAVGVSGVVWGADGTGGKPMGLARTERETAMPARQALGLEIADLNVDGVALSKVLDYLRDVSGANLVVNWKVLEAANVTKETPITLNVTGVPLRKVLRLVLDQASPSTMLVFPVDSNVISITSEEEADKVLVTKVYVVDDLVMTDNKAVVPPTMDLQKMTSSGNTVGGSGGGGGGGGGGGLFTQDNANGAGAASDDTPEKRGEELVKLIEECVRPTIWKDAGGTAAIRYMSGKLIVTAPISVQEAIGGPYMPEGGQRLRGF